MSRHESRLFRAELKDAQGASVVSNGKSLASRQYLKCCEFERGSALVASFALVSKRRIDTLSNVDILGLPPITEMAPYVDTEIRGAGSEALCRLVDEVGLVGHEGATHLRRMRAHPLQASNLLEVSTLVAQNSIRRRSHNFAIDDCKAAVFVADHQETLVSGRLNAIYGWANLA